MKPLLETITFGEFWMPLYADIVSDGNLDRYKKRAAAYATYLNEISEFLPAETRQFALSEWYYRDPDKCPHDAWVESFEIFENFAGERKEHRNIGIRIRLLAASHRGHIHFAYENVFGYGLNFSPTVRVWDEKLVLPKHGDWMADEISLNSHGHVVHEIHFSSGCIWRIEAESVSYSFGPINDEHGVHAQA
jgi:hypothetical protein